MFMIRNYKVFFLSGKILNILVVKAPLIYAKNPRVFGFNSPGLVGVRNVSTLDHCGIAEV